MSLGLLLSFLTLVVSFGSYGSNDGVVAAADGVPIHYSVTGKGQQPANYSQYCSLTAG